LFCSISKIASFKVDDFMASIAAMALLAVIYRVVIEVV
jgi:hypothetical protein